jgi:hypothetical protein
MRTRKVAVIVGGLVLFLTVGGETYANKHAIESFRTRWNRPSASELLLQVDTASLQPTNASLAHYSIAVESSPGPQTGAPMPWKTVTNLPTADLPFVTTTTGDDPVFFRLKLLPR